MAIKDRQNYDRIREYYAVLNGQIDNSDAPRSYKEVSCRKNMFNGSTTFPPSVQSMRSVPVHKAVQDNSVEHKMQIVRPQNLSKFVERFKNSKCPIRSFLFATFLNVDGAMI